MDKDIGLDIVTDAYIIQHIHPPRVDLSEEFIKALTDEFRRLMDEGKDVKVISRRIDYLCKDLSPEIKKTYLPKKKKINERS
jgi:hypothetical protein